MLLIPQVGLKIRVFNGQRNRQNLISQRVASAPLVQLCSKLHAATGTLLSLEGLNKRLNTKAVLFLQYIFLYNKNAVNKHRL